MNDDDGATKEGEASQMAQVEVQILKRLWYFCNIIGRDVLAFEYKDKGKEEEEWWLNSRLGVPKSALCALTVYTELVERHIPDHEQWSRYDGQVLQVIIQNQEFHDILH